MRSKNSGKNIGRKGISGGDADPPANLLYPTAGSQSDGIRRVTHDADMTEQVQPGLCQHQLAAQPFKQGHAQIGLERQNLPRQCGLRQTKLACRSRQGSGSGGRVKCANMIPVNRIHAFLYIMPTDFDTFFFFYAYAKPHRRGAPTMSIASDARFWDRTSRKYATGAIADQAGYERTLDRTRALLGSNDRVLELGCGTGTTALRLAGDVQEYLATDISAGMIAIANEKHAAGPIPALVFRTATAEALSLRRAVQRSSGIQLSPSGPRPARHAAQHPRLARSGRLVHLQDTLPRGYEPTHPACLCPRCARSESTLCQASFGRRT